MLLFLCMSNTHTVQDREVCGQRKGCMLVLDREVENLPLLLTLFEYDKLINMVLCMRQKKMLYSSLQKHVYELF